jgi:hypothetical protein
VAAHLRRRAAGEPADRDYERTSLQNAGVDTLAIAEILLLFADERGWAADEVVEAMRRSPLRIAPPEVAAVVELLVQRLAILRVHFTEVEGRVLLEKGVVGPGNEVHAVGRHLTIGFLVNYLSSLGLLDLRR